MGNIRLNRATNALAHYYGLYTLNDLASNGNSGTTSTESGPVTNNMPQLSPTMREVVRMLVDTSEGGVLTKNLLSNLNSFTSSDSGSTDELNSNIRIYYDSTRLTGVTEETNPTINSLLGSIRHPYVNSTPNSPTKETPSLSVIEVNHVHITPASKNTNAITIFMNGIPSIELARAVPYVDVQFQFSRTPRNEQHQVQTLSLYKFLEGAAIVDDGSTDATLIEGATSSTEIAGEQSRRVATAGMELFTSPQTLVNANDHSANRALRANAVQDKFRPFLTLKGITIDVQPSGGLMSFKSGKMEFILHDKSRLAEMADFISPNLYGGTDILLEYGWIHPDGPEAKNNFADIINGMRAKEKYGIYNSSFAFDDNGQVQITLQIAMRGGPEFRTETIGDSSDDTVRNLVREIDRLQESIGELRRRRSQNRLPAAREIRGVQILDAAEDARSNLVLTTDMRNALRQFQDEVRRSHGNPDLTALNQQITQLFGNARRPSTNQPLTTQLLTTVRSSIQTKFDAAMSGNDPFFVEEQDNAGQQSNSGNRRNGQGSNNANRPKVSLGKLLLTFIGEPLAATKKFDDVQLVFYPFNSYAGFARDKNIAQFAVDKNYFVNQYAQYRLNNVSRSGNMQLRDFLTFIGSTIIDDPAAESYGLQAYRHRDRGNGNNQTTTSEPISTDAVATQNRIDNALLHGAGGQPITPDGSFRMPQIDFFVECIPEDPNKITDQDERNFALRSEANLKSILRVHIFDRQNTGYDSLSSLLAAMRDDYIMHINPPPAPNQQNQAVANSHNQAITDVTQRAVNQNIIRAVNNSQQIPEGDNALPWPRGVYEVIGGPQQIKEFVMNTMPYIIQGAGGTAVKRAALSSMHDPALTTVNMLRSFRASPTEPNGERPGGLPLQIIPCELQMTTFGCPLIDFAQQFFIDFNTSTTVDNIYAVVGLSHTLGAGKFDTELKLSPLDAYGRYVSLIERLGATSNVMDDMNTNQNSGQTNGRGGSR
jgi:hypothetical protein